MILSSNCVNFFSQITLCSTWAKSFPICYFFRLQFHWIQFKSDLFVLVQLQVLSPPMWATLHFLYVSLACFKVLPRMFSSASGNHFLMLFDFLKKKCFLFSLKTYSVQNLYIFHHFFQFAFNAVTFCDNSSCIVCFPLSSNLYYPFNYDPLEFPYSI